MTLTISSFKYAHQLYVLKRPPFRLLQEQAMLFAHIGADVDATDALDITDEHVWYLLSHGRR